MKTKTNKQLKNACLFAFVALWSICGTRAQSPEQLWEVGNTAMYPQYIVYGNGPDAGYHRKPMGTDVVIPETIWYVNGASGTLGGGGGGISDGGIDLTITDFNFNGPYTVTSIDLLPSDEDKVTVRSISYPSTVTTIWSMADFRNLQSIDILPTVTTIYGGAFRNDSSLVSVVIPATVTSIEDYVFSNCTALESVTILNSEIGNSQFDHCTSLKNVVISDNVTKIGGSAFGSGNAAVSDTYCPNVETLTVPSSVTTIADGAFLGLTGLKTLNFHAKTVPQYNFQSAFFNFSSYVNALPIENLDLTGVETIEPHAFAGCSQLKNLILPETLKTIGNEAFRNDSALTAITIPATVTSIGNNVFIYCIALESATILNSAIGSQQFANCTALKNVTISDNVTTIGDNAFWACTNLTNITIPDNVTTIGYSSFWDCTNLKDVTVNWQTPLSVPSSVFAGVNTQAATLHVPAGTTALYKAAPVWKDFFSIVEDAPTAIKTVDNASFHACFINNALRIESPNAELINIYSITGSLLYSGKKNEGAFEIPFSPIQGVYIIKGSVSGTIKTVK